MQYKHTLGVHKLRRNGRIWEKGEVWQSSLPTRGRNRDMISVAMGLFGSSGGKELRGLNIRLRSRLRRCCSVLPPQGSLWSSVHFTQWIFQIEPEEWKATCSGGENQQWHYDLHQLRIWPGESLLAVCSHKRTRIHFVNAADICDFGARS